MVQAQKKTFAQALNNTCDILFHSCLFLASRDILIFVQIDEDVYLVGLEDCKNHLHGRIVLSKGDKPLTHIVICKKLILLGNLWDLGKLFLCEKGFMNLFFLPLKTLEKS